MSNELKRTLLELVIKLIMVTFILIPSSCSYWVGLREGKAKERHRYAEVSTDCAFGLSKQDDILPGFMNLVINNTCIETSEMAKIYVDSQMFNCMEEKMKQNE